MFLVISKRTRVCHISEKLSKLDLASSRTICLLVFLGWWMLQEKKNMFIFLISIKQAPKAAITLATT
jgi:hypothetical protein